jgi:hypothetical protein
MIEKPKKERRLLKVLGRVGEILIQEVLLKVGSNLIKRIGGKKTLPSILFLFISISLFAQYPSTGNKQRLGFQTTADGLVWRGSISDTASIQPVSNQNAWVILDTVNLKLYSFDFTSNVWNALPQGTNIDTTSLSNRINLKLNISDTAAMLLPYAKKSYVDTAGRFYARQDFTNVSSSTLTWTQTDTLVPAGVNVVQVYRNGQILLPTQYTIPTNASVVIGSTAFKLGENYTVIFPKGGGGSGSGGSGSLTSISGGTGITVSPDPITTTGTVSADLTVLMELSDTVTLSNRINNKVNISDTASMLLPYFRDADTSSLNLTSRFALKLNAADTASLSNRINAKGTGTVTSVGSGFGLLGGTITMTGTLRLDTSTIYARLQDSINVAIGGDTIKILKQEYQPALSSVLTWTITPKFPIQLKAYILVFRNGQLLNNDQYNLTDTNKITIVSTSFKTGANYTVATVSGIGSIGTGVFPNPVYPEAGIALSTGSAWASSIPNNSSNWNIAYNDKINNAAFTGTTTKTLTLSQVDGGTITAPFTDLQGIVAGDTASMLLPYLRRADTTNMLLPYFRDADTTSLNLTSRFAAKQNTLNGTGFVKALGTNITYDNSSYLRTGLADSTYLKLTGGTLTGNLRLSSSNATQLNIDANDNNLESRITFSTVGSARSKIYTTSSVSSMTFESIAQASAKRGFRFISSTEGTQYLGLVQDPQGNVGIKSDATGNDVHPNTLYVDGTLGVTGAITEGGNNVLTNLDTVSLSNRIDAKYNSSGGTISGAVTLSTTSATPSSLLGKDGSNVVGTVTTVAQTGLFGRGSVTNAVTDSNGNITVVHGFNFTPIMAFANLPGQTTNIVNVKSVDGTNIVFVVRDGATNDVLNTISVAKIEFFAIK